MRFESIPKKIVNGITAVFKHIRQEFGIWSYVIIAFAILLLYKPVIRFMNAFSEIVTYIFLGALALGILYLIIKRIFR